MTWSPAARADAQAAQSLCGFFACHNLPVDFGLRLEEIPFGQL
jgi:hypothetical protein